MFEQYADYFWVALFAALVLYGIGNTIQVPFMVRRFYRNNGFVDQGESSFDDASLSHAVLLQALKASHVYSGTYRDFEVSQFAAFSVDRRKFTPNKIKRKRNQQVWTVTVVHNAVQCPEFCARPTRVTDAPAYVLGEEGVKFAEDAENFANKVHVVAADHASVRQLFTPYLREQLTGIDPVSLESLGGALLYRTPRLPHDAGAKLQQDLNLLINIAEHINTQ